MTVDKSAGKKKSQTGQLRIVAGNWRSRLLQIADLPGLRPTSSRIRETLFNWLAPQIHGSRCLDLCAGTGALGIEALSRGAASAVFVEKSRAAARVLIDNLAILDAGNANVAVTDAREYLTESAAAQFDIVFIDPPFAAGLHDELCRLLVEKGWLANTARIYIEFGKDRTPPCLPQDWRVLKNKSAGNVRYMLVSAAEGGAPK